MAAVIQTPVVAGASRLATGGPNLFTRFWRYVRVLAEVFAEAQELRRQAQRRYPHLEV